MNEEKSDKTLFGLTPAKYGIASLISACIAVICGFFLLVVLGWVLWFLILFLSVLTAVVCGLLGVGAGIYHKDWLGIVTGSLGLVLIGFGSWRIMWAIMNF